MLNIIIPNKLRMVKKLFTKGSSTLLRAHGRVGASATTLSFLSAPPSEKSAGGFQQAGKKEGGWGEGIFARLLPFPFRLSKRKAEGGFGGNSAFLLPNQNEASPATCLNTWKAEHHRKILFSLGEIRRASHTIVFGELRGRQKKTADIAFSCPLYGVQITGGGGGIRTHGAF